jgi:PhzF family phenazine biosynthesis protein
MKLFIVDAFTDRPFAGNPAAVCLLKEERDVEWMQAVAAETNLSETAFVRPLVSPDHLVEIEIDAVVTGKPTEGGSRDPVAWQKHEDHNVGR